MVTYSNRNNWMYNTDTNIENYILSSSYFVMIKNNKMSWWDYNLYDKDDRIRITNTETSEYITIRRLSNIVNDNNNLINRTSIYLKPGNYKIENLSESLIMVFIINKNFNNHQSRTWIIPFLYLSGLSSENNKYIEKRLSRTMSTIQVKQSKTFNIDSLL